MQTENNLVERLSESKVYSDYERAFSDATGLPLRLRSVESWQLPHHGQRKENECVQRASRFSSHWLKQPVTMPAA